MKCCNTAEKLKCVSREYLSIVTCIINDTIQRNSTNLHKSFKNLNECFVNIKRLRISIVQTHII